MAPHLALGTAQFGLEYGVVNQRERQRQADVCRIIDLARVAGVRSIDTAAAYGDSEKVLGRCGVGDFEIVTKVSSLSGDAPSIGAACDSARRSLDRLQCERLYGLLLHSAADLLGPFGSAVYASLCDARDRGLTQRIGVSVYTAEEVNAVLARFRVDLIQLPLSVLDQRMTSCLPRLKDTGVAVHVRSVFLQGLLLVSPAAVPARLVSLRLAIETFQGRAAEAGLRPIEAAIAFVKGLPEVDQIIVGCAQPREFEDSILAFKRDATFDAAGLSVPDGRLVDPRNWMTA